MTSVSALPCKNVNMKITSFHSYTVLLICQPAA